MGPLGVQVCAIQATNSSFAALRTDGSVVTWAGTFGGGGWAAVREVSLSLG